eukprot:12073371-Alexandrium_andersonii.AAC.1
MQVSVWGGGSRTDNPTMAVECDAPGARTERCALVNDSDMRSVCQVNASRVVEQTMLLNWGCQS